MSLPPSTAGKFRWDRLTYSSALGYALLAGGQSIGFVLGELRHQFRLSGVIAALHGSVFGLTDSQPDCVVCRWSIGSAGAPHWLQGR